MSKQQVARNVLQDVIVLHVNGYFGFLHESQASSHRFDAIVQQIESGLSRVRGNQRLGLLRQQGVPGVTNRTAGLFFVIRWQAGTGTEEHNDQ